MPLISYKWSVEKCKSVRTLYSLQYKEPFGDSNYPSYFYFYKLLNYLSAANGSTHCLLTSPSRQGAEVSFAWSILSIACQQRRQRLRLWSIFIQLEARKQFFLLILSSLALSWQITGYNAALLGKVEILGPWTQRRQFIVSASR